MMNVSEVDPIFGIINKSSIYEEDILRTNQPWRCPLLEDEVDPKFRPYWFEVHDNLYWRKTVWEHPYYPYVANVVYLATLLVLQRWMKDKAPFKLRTPLIIWNWGLGLFSLFGFWRIGQEMVHVWGQEDGFHKSICETGYHYTPAAFWGLLFMLSKYAELGDTIFLALKKQPILALQWYHHTLVTVFAWVLYSWQEPILRWYSFMNYGAHGIMYPYFALRAMNIKVPESCAMAITTIQVAQMIAGVSLNVYALYTWATGGSCARNPTSIAFSLLTYFSLGVMFAQFFISKYIARTRKKNKLA
jgi:hypothetical protein